MVKREILRLIEEKLGYEFKLEELPPNLRAKIRKLEEERDIILRESLLYEEYKRRVIDGMQEHQRRISEFYDKKLRKPRGACLISILKDGF